MEKIDVVLVLLNQYLPESTVKKLNPDNVNLIAVLTNCATEETFDFGGNTVSPVPFSGLLEFIAKNKDTYQNYIWAINGCRLDKLKNFLISLNVPEKNIVNLETPAQISKTWIANLRYIEKNGADFFVTGNEYMQTNLDLKNIPRVHVDSSLERGGVNLSDVYQDLRQSYQIAKHVFAHVKPSTIKFVIIGLMPYSFRYDNTKDFLHCPKNLQYRFALDNVNETEHDRLLQTLLVEDFKEIFTTVDVEQTDLNFDSKKSKLGEIFNADSIIDWDYDLKFLTKSVEEDNVQILEDYIRLCLDNGAKPVGVGFPFAPIAKKVYTGKLLNGFRETIARLEKDYDFKFLDLFGRLMYDCFADMTHFNPAGMIYGSTLLAMKLNMLDLIPTESFCDMTYAYFYNLSRVAHLNHKNEYNTLMKNIFTTSAQKIRLKNKIKLGFVMIEAAHWCGKDLYNFFANDDRFDVTVFLSRDFHKDRNELVKKDFLRGVEQLKSHGLNVVAVDKRKAVVPTQDIIIFLSPYINWMAHAFNLQNLKPQTLLGHIFYAFDSSIHAKNYYNNYMFPVAWKMFFSSLIDFKLFDKKSDIGMPRGVYSGYPRMDIFFKDDAQFQFDWKMTRPDAKKIIWAPHHSIKGEAVIKYATFQWNYKFMYEFAKVHPEISWVVKPHPMLLYKAIKDGVFPNAEALQEYLQAWNDLPNAQVYTGGYYQAIFATSDGMIHDCGSFMAEYQFMDKPMIYLTRDTQKYNDLGKKILSVSYCVDGKDTDAIAATMQRVFIDGDDYKATERRELFDEYLNYPKANGMLASEFIYRNICKELMG